MGCSACQKAAASRAGDAPHNAIVLGAPSGATAYRVKVLTRGIPGLLLGAVKYVRGSSVQGFFDDGTLELLNAVALTPHNARRGGGKLYYVGDVGYTDIAAARVRSGETGLPIQERTVTD